MSGADAADPDPGASRSSRDPDRAGAAGGPPDRHLSRVLRRCSRRVGEAFDDATTTGQTSEPADPEPPRVPRPGELRGRRHDRAVQHRAEHGHVQHPGRRPRRPDYKGLVCLFLSRRHRLVQRARPARRRPSTPSTPRCARDLALPQDVLLPITPGTPDGREYGLHPGLRRAADAVRAGPRWRFWPTSARWSSRRRCSSTAMAALRCRSGCSRTRTRRCTGRPRSPTSARPSGWAGRMADILQAGNCNQNISMNISLSGSNVFQTGNLTAHYTITENGSRGLYEYGGAVAQRAGAHRGRRRPARPALPAPVREDLRRPHARRDRRARRILARRSPRCRRSRPQFSNTPLSQRSADDRADDRRARSAGHAAARRSSSSVGGWDHHDEVLLNQEAMLPVVSRALSEFYAALAELGVAERGDAVHRVRLRPHAELERPRLGPRLGRQSHRDGRRRARAATSTAASRRCTRATRSTPIAGA